MENWTLSLAVIQNAAARVLRREPFVQRSEKNDDYELNSKDDGGLDSGHTRCVSTLDFFVTHEKNPEELFECTQ